MPNPLHTPRLNNNDDIVTVRQIITPAGSSVRKGDPIVELETDKAVFVVESEQDGWILKLLCSEGDQVAVGSVLAWLGESSDEAAPVDGAAASPKSAATAPPTARAQLLLAKYGLQAGDVPFEGERLTAAIVDAYVVARGLQPKAKAAAAAAPAPATAARPLSPGRAQALNTEERGMLRTVLWQREHAVPGYIEVPCDEAAWKAYGLELQKRERMLVNPVLSLMAWRLTELARENEKLNATLVDGARHVYTQVNLGFTVQSGEALYLTVVEDAGSLDEVRFVNRLAELQRHAMAHRLSPSEIQGATISFSSMARWQVTRHVPVLPPFTSLIVAHAPGLLGATYDHRVLSGFDVVNALKKMAAPPARSEA
jgi:pyruvate/2-oxoglutarate dehydrogenase complex dihydrolipoamide acyltransferase (E2) component